MTEIKHRYRTPTQAKNDRLKQGRKSNDLERYFQLNIVSALLFVFAFISLSYLTYKYIGKDPYGDFALVLIILGSIGMGIGIISKIIHQKALLTFQDKYLNLQDDISLMMWGACVVGICALLGIVWWFLGSTLRYALSREEIYFYFISAAIMEEIFFRYGLCGVMKVELFPRLHLELGDHFENITISLITAFIFMLSHWEYYGGSQIGMAAMFIGGIIFAIVYLYTKDISISMVAHVIVNLIAVGHLLMTAGG